MPEVINKLQPNRTVSLAGFNARGAAAAIVEATTSSMKMSGVWNAFGDAAVLDCFTAHDFFSHPRIKYLPDFDFTGIVWQFDLQTHQWSQGIESPKSPQTAWDVLSVIQTDATGLEGAPTTIKLFDHAMLQAGVLTPAAATWHITAAGSLNASDAISFQHRNIEFLYTGTGGVGSAGPADYTYFTQTVGYTHTLTIAGTTYSHVQAIGEFGLDAAVAIAAAAASDPHCTVFNNSVPISGMTGAGVLIQVTTSTPHQLATGYAVKITGALGNTAANGVNFVHVIDAHNFTLDGTTGNGTYTGSATLVGSNHLLITALAGTVVLSASDGNAGVTLVVVGADAAAASIAAQINGYNWVFEGPSVALIASASGTDLTVQAARYGTVDVASDGVTVTWATGDKFPGIATGSRCFINGVANTVSTVNSPTSITLGTTTGGALTGVSYLAERGGFDGNMIAVNCRAKGQLDTTGSATVGDFKQNNKKLTGGNSDVTWRITIDFSALSIPYLRRAWLTFAPLLADSSDFVKTEFEIDFTNWGITGGSQELKVAAPGSTRVGTKDIGSSVLGTRFAGTWGQQTAGWYWQGAAQYSSTVGDVVTVNYSCQFTHDLYLGTELLSDRGTVNASLDGDTPTAIDAYAATTDPILTRRKVRSSVAPGLHTVTFKLNGPGGGAGSLFLFDFLEAAVVGDVPDAPENRSDVTLATDFDTDHGYRLPPERQIWILDKLGMQGHRNMYFGVFFYDERVRVAGTNKSASFAISGSWAVADYIELNISGIAVRKTLRTMDVSASGAATIATLAQGLVDRINDTFIGVWAEVTGGDTVVVHVRAALFYFPLGFTKSGGTVTLTGDLNPGCEGVWQIDTGATNQLNKAARDYLTGTCATTAAYGYPGITIAYSMEKLNPPAAWSAVFKTGLRVSTDVGFGTEAQSTITAVTATSPAQVTTAGDHGYQTGDSLNIAVDMGSGPHSATVNGVRLITVLNSTQFTLDGTTGLGTFNGFDFTLNPVVPFCNRRLRTIQCAPSQPGFLAHQQALYSSTAQTMNAAGVTPWVQFGEFLWWYFSRRSATVEGVSGSGVVHITGHQLTTGEMAILAGARGMGNINGTRQVTVVDADHFTLDGYTAVGGWAGGGLLKSGGMAFYDTDTVAAAALALGRPLATFYTQDDDASINSFADVDFLSERLKAHVDAIMMAATLAQPGTMYESLFPCDVTTSPCYHTLDFPFPQGGRVNARVSFPAAWASKSLSGFDTMKIEALSWVNFYRNSDLAKASVRFAITTPGTWSPADVRYLTSVENWGSAWAANFLDAQSQGFGGYALWAFDQWCLIGWPVPLPRYRGKSSVT